MAHFDKTMERQIEEAYSELTSVERSIADFFLHNKEKMNFSSKSIASKLYVSEASLSRFAKKCNYKGFREFIYNYERTFDRDKGASDINALTQRVLSTYQDLLDRTLGMVNEKQMHRISKMLSEAKRVYVYGMGSSGIAAHEFKLRFMRLGLWVEAINDSHMIKMNSALLDPDTLVIAFSISGITPEIISGIRIGRKQGAKVVMVTSNKSEKLKEICDEVLNIAVTKDLEGGTQISPQFPILIMVDMFYTYYLNTDFYYKTSKHTETLSALYSGNKV